MRRVFVTGLGAITPVGITREGLWEGVRENRIGIRRPRRFDPTPFRSQVAGEVEGFEPARWIAPKALRRMDRYSRFSVAAGIMALEDAGIRIEREDAERVGCYLGSAIGGVGFAEMQYNEYSRGGLRALDPSLSFSVFGGAGSCNLAIQLGLNGPNSANGDSCASGPIAIGRAMRTIQSGEADVMLAGAAEAPVTMLAFAAFDTIRAMSSRYNAEPSRACRPFDSGRDGFVLGEGAAMLVLESEEHARRRGAVCLAEVCGYALTNDGSHMTAPRSDAAQSTRAIRLSLENAGVRPDEIDVISAHGSSTPLNDGTETKAIKQALGDHAYKVPVIATKSRHAHSLGASGAIEAAIFVMGLYHQWLPGALNLDTPSPDCDLNYGQEGPTKGPFRVALSNSFGFGGINCCLVLRAADTADPT